jgi:hypothetical protein
MATDSLPDYAAVTGWSLERLDGPEREAFYAWRSGNVDRARAIRTAYELPSGELVLARRPGDPLELVDPTPKRPEPEPERDRTSADDPAVEVAVDEAPERRTGRRTRKS